MLDGSIVQSVEVAGQDVGPTVNGFSQSFSIGYLEVINAVEVTFIDDTDNDGVGQVARTEAL